MSWICLKFFPLQQVFIHTFLDYAFENIVWGEKWAKHLKCDFEKNQIRKQTSKLFIDAVQTSYKQKALIVSNKKNRKYDLEICFSSKEEIKKLFTLFSNIFQCYFSLNFWSYNESESTENESEFSIQTDLRTKDKKIEISPIEENPLYPTNNFPVDHFLSDADFETDLFDFGELEKTDFLNEHSKFEESVLNSSDIFLPDPPILSHPEILPFPQEKSSDNSHSKRSKSPSSTSSSFSKSSREESPRRSSKSNKHSKKRSHEESEIPSEIVHIYGNEPLTKCAKTNSEPSKKESTERPQKKKRTKPKNTVSRLSASSSDSEYQKNQSDLESETDSSNSEAENNLEKRQNQEKEIEEGKKRIKTGIPLHHEHFGKLIESLNNRTLDSPQKQIETLCLNLHTCEELTKFFLNFHQTLVSMLKGKPITVDSKGNLIFTCEHPCIFCCPQNWNVPKQRGRPRGSTKNKKQTQKETQKESQKEEEEKEQEKKRKKQEKKVR